MTKINFNKVIEKYIFWIPKFLSRIGSFTLILMMFLTVADVLLRKVLSKSILGTVEVTEFMMVILVFFGLANAEILNANIKVDILMNRFKERTQMIVETFTQFFSFLVFVFITRYSFIYAGSKIGSGEVSQDLWIPVYPFVYLVALGCGLLTIVLFFKSIMAFIKAVSS